MRKINYITSPKQDDLLHPSEYRRYTNHIFTSYVATFAVATTAIGSQIFGGDYHFWELAADILHHDLSVFNTLSLPVFTAKTLFATIPSAVAAHYLTKKFTKAINRQQHLSGNFLDDSPEVVDNLADDFNKPNNPKKCAMLREGDMDWNKERPRPLNNSIYWPQEVDELSMIVRGEAGSGKSVFLDRISKEAIDTNNKVILHSIKGDEIKKLDGYCDFYVIEPWNKTRGYAINFLSLVVNDDETKENAAITELVNSFNKNTKNDFFQNGAGSVTEAFVRYAVKSTKVNGICEGDFTTVSEKWNSFQVNPVNLPDDLNDQQAVHDEYNKHANQLQAIKQFLQVWNTAATTYVDPKSEKTSICVLASCIAIMRKFELLANFWKDHKAKGKVLDIRKWINTRPEKDRKVIILVNSNQFADVADCYISAFINLTVNEVIEESYQAPWQLHFILDEFPQLSSINIQAFLKLPDVGRGKGIRTKIAMQRSSQAKIFNIEPESLVGAFQTKIWCRMATDDFKNVESELGKRDFYEWKMSGNNNAQGKSSTNNKTLESKPVVNPNDLQNRLGPQFDKKGNFMGVSVLMKLPNNPRAALVIMPPVTFTKKPRNAAHLRGSAAPKTHKHRKYSGDDSIEEVVITETLERDHLIQAGIPQAQIELEQDGQNPISSAITESVAHAVGGEPLSALIQAGEMLEALEGTPNNNTNIVTVEESTTETKKLVLKSKNKGKSYNLDQELDL